MKIQQTNTEFTIKMGAGSAIAMGTVLTVIGLVVAIALLGTEQKWPALFGLIFVAIGAYTILNATSRHIVFEKEGNTTITDKKVFFGSPKIDSFPTNSINGVSVESHTEYRNRSVNDTNGSYDRTVSEPVLVGILSIMRNDGSVIAIDSASRNQSMSGGGFSVNGIPVGGIISTLKSFSGKAPLSSEGEKLAGFLGVPFNSAGPTGNIVSDVKSAFSSQSQQYPSATNTQPPVSPVPTVPQAGQSQQAQSQINIPPSPPSGGSQSPSAGPGAQF